MIFNPLGFWEKVSKIELFIYTVLYTVCFTYICKSKKNISTNFLNIFNFTISCYEKMYSIVCSTYKL